MWVVAVVPKRAASPQRYFGFVRASVTINDDAYLAVKELTLNLNEIFSANSLQIV
ncbi:predicted protein [Histoplasma mississippiense (nom. inval.)]|uniref:predicted protein n=1 Tax=Ajellomyces capsulatus (strain NAm1 / WU24) TaxID=2059318 RepID=UPI000157CBB1|nr:predicted protein [Histoplasma mississippiense (nom. inval.)]EDN10042.1 predicted protein [Histoplasma mississippiense (nom. inval.)]